MIICIPGQRSKNTVGETASLIDVAPTVAHILGISTENTAFLGRDLFARALDPVVPLNNGMFLTNGEVVGGEGRALDASLESDSNLKTSNSNRSSIGTARMIGSVSQRIIQWDLIDQLRSLVTESPSVDKGTPEAD